MWSGSLRRATSPLHIGMELRSSGAIKQAVAAELGIAVMPQARIELELLAGRLVTLNVAGFPSTATGRWRGARGATSRRRRRAVELPPHLSRPGRDAHVRRQATGQ